MKLPEQNRVGLSTIGLAGCIVLAGVIFGNLHPAWLTASAILMLMGVGIESGRSAR
jgi:hypothetical protein